MCFPEAGVILGGAVTLGACTGETAAMGSIATWEQGSVMFCHAGVTTFSEERGNHDQGRQWNP